jgi:hypothetical protein
MLQLTTSSATRGVSMFVFYVHAQTREDSASGVTRTAGRRAASGLFREFQYSKNWLFIILQEQYFLQEVMLRIQAKCKHNKHPHIKVGTVNRQYNETVLYLHEAVSLLSLPVLFIVDEGKSACVFAMKAHRELEVRPH